MRAIKPCVYCGNDMSVVDLRGYRRPSEMKGVCLPCSQVIWYLENNPAAARKIVDGMYDPELDGPEVVFIRNETPPFVPKVMCEYWQRRSLWHAERMRRAWHPEWFRTYDELLLADFEREAMP